MSIYNARDIVQFIILITLLLVYYVLFKRKGVNHKPIQLLSYFLGVAVGFELTHKLLKFFFSIKTIWIADILIFLELGIFSSILFCFVKSKAIRQSFYAALLFWLFCFVVLKLLNIEMFGFVTYSYYSRPIGFIIMLIMGIVTLIHHGNNTLYHSKVFTYIYWLIIGIVVYSIGHSLVYAGMFLIDDPLLTKIGIWVLLSTNALSYILFSVAALVYYRETAQSTL